MKGKVLEFKKRVSEGDMERALTNYALRALELERAAGAESLKREERLIAEANLRRQLLSIAEQFDL